MFFNAAFGQLVRESGQFEWDGDGKRKGFGGYDGKVGVLCVCVCVCVCVGD